MGVAIDFAWFWLNNPVRFWIIGLSMSKAWIRTRYRFIDGNRERMGTCACVYFESVYSNLYCAKEAQGRIISFYEKVREAWSLDHERNYIRVRRIIKWWKKIHISEIKFLKVVVMRYLFSLTIRTASFVVTVNICVVSFIHFTRVCRGDISLQTLISLWSLPITPAQLLCLDEWSQQSLSEVDYIKRCCHHWFKSIT